MHYILVFNHQICIIQHGSSKSLYHEGEDHEGTVDKISSDTPFTKGHVSVKSLPGIGYFPLRGLYKEYGIEGRYN